MAVTSIFRDTNNNVSLVRMTVTDTIAQVEAADYIKNNQEDINDLNGGTWGWFTTDMLLVAASDGQAFFQFTDTSFESLEIYGQQGGGTVNPGLANELAYYPSAGTSLDGVPTAANGVLITSGAGVPSISSTLPSAVQGNITALGTIASGTWNGSVIAGQYGGTGVANTGKTITMGGNITTSGAFNFTATLTGDTNVVFPTSGSLATTSNLPSGEALTRVDDTNVTLTLGGSPSTALFAATSITAGWTGQLSLTRGGTNASLTASNGGIIYSTATAFAVLSGTATANQVLLSGSSAAPAWSTATYPATTTINQILYSSAANVIGEITAVNSGVLVSSSAGVPSFSSTMTDGQLIIGSTGATPTAATLTQGSGITITNGPGTITIATSASGFTWNDVSGTTQAAAVNNGYIISNASQTNVTLPATAAVGSVISIAGKGAAGWIMTANTGQVIHIGNQATSTAGTLTSTNQWDCVSVVCVTANTTWNVTSAVGNITYA